MQPEIAATKRGRDSRVAGRRAEVRTSRALHVAVVLTALPTPLPTPPRCAGRECVRGRVEQLGHGATSSSMQGEPLPPHMPCLPAHMLTY